MQLILKEISGPLPTSFFELIQDDKTIGKLQLRHSPSKNVAFPEGFESHIYYEIDPLYQRKGYGTKMLALGLEKARDLGLKEVVLTCLESNNASQKIIERNGGKLMDRRLESGGSVVYKYKIIL